MGWRQVAALEPTHQTLHRYLDIIFTYAGSYSLARELNTVPDPVLMQIGDVFIEGGFPGHAAIIVDMARAETTGKTIFLLAQSYMPAQNIHILKNLNNYHLSPWYEVDFANTLHTPEWTFQRTHLRRFK